jgi:transposase-like protein
MKLELSQIRLDGGTQPRAALRTDVIEEYAELMKAGTRFDPVIVYFDGTDYWLADGYHRVAAARRAYPDQPIEAEVHEGTLAEAQWYSYGANRTHGLRRTNEDKERAVRNALQHRNALGLSNVQIAEHCGVSEFLIRKYRREQELEPSSIKSKIRTVTRRGTTYRQNTAQIGKHMRKAANGRRRISPKAATPILGHSLPNPMISLSLPPGNPVLAAATIFKLFDTTFVRALVAELTQRLKGKDHDESQPTH